MYIINIFLNYFSKHFFRKIQIFIQLSVSIVAVLIFVGMLLNINSKLDDIKSITSLSNIKGNFSIDSKTRDINSANKNSNINELLTELKSYNSYFDFGRFLTTSNNDIYQISIDNTLLNSINFPVDEGRTLASTDFNINLDIEPIPILISKKLADKYSINSEITLGSTPYTNENNFLNGGAKFKVVGILNDDSKFWISDDILLDKLNYFEVIIFPVNFESLKYYSPYYFLNLKCDNNFYKDFKTSMEIKYPNVKLIDSSLKDSFVNKLQNKIIELIFVGSFTIALLILSLFGFISIIKSTILLRCKEIGIHYALGGSLINICMFILIETLLISFSSLFICYLSVSELKDYFMINYELMLGWQTFLIATIVILIYIFIAIITIFFTVLKKDPVVLIRE